MGSVHFQVVCLQKVVSYFVPGIQKLVLAGRMGEAIKTTQELYPGLLERNANLLFMLKCRQFIEMVNGTDSEVRPRHNSPIHSGQPSPYMSPVHAPVAPQRGSSLGLTHLATQTGHIAAAVPAKSHSGHSSSPSGSTTSSHNIIPGSQQPHIPMSSSSSSSSSMFSSNSSSSGSNNSVTDLTTVNEEDLNAVNAALNGNPHLIMSDRIADNEVDMDIDSNDTTSATKTLSNGTTSASNGTCLNGAGFDDDQDDDMG